MQGRAENSARVCLFTRIGTTFNPCFSAWMVLAPVSVPVRVRDLIFELMYCACGCVRQLPNLGSILAAFPPARPHQASQADPATQALPEEFPRGENVGEHHRSAYAALPLCLSTGEGCFEDAASLSFSPPNPRQVERISMRRVEEPESFSS